MDAFELICIDNKHTNTHIYIYIDAPKTTMPKHSREQTIHMWTFCSGLANFMDSMEGKLDFKERSLANEMVKAQPQESKRAPCLTGEDLLMHQIMELPCTSGGVEFNTSQIREKIRNKHRSDNKIAEKILAAVPKLEDNGLLLMKRHEKPNRGGRKVQTYAKPTLSQVEANQKATEERMRLNIGKDKFP